MRLNEQNTTAKETRTMNMNAGTSTRRNAIGTAIAAFALVLTAGQLGAATIITNWSFDSDFTATTGSSPNDAATGSGDPAISSSGSMLGGGHANFDGDDWLEVTQLSDYTLGTGQVSYSLWFRDAGSVTSDRLLATGASANDQEGYALTIADRGGAVSGQTNKFFTALTSDGSGRRVQDANANGSVDPFGGSWHLVVATMDNTGSELVMNVYVDGVLETTTSGVNLDGTVDSSVGNTQSDLAIGARDDAATNKRPIVGDLDDVAIWDGVLTQNDVDYLWNDGSGMSALDVWQIPEPATLALLVLGLTTLCGRRRRGK